MFRAEDKPLRVSLSSRRQNQKFSWRDSSIMFVSSLQLVDPMGSILICMVTSIGGTVLHNYCLMNCKVKAKRRRRSRAGHKRCFCGQLQFYEIIISVKRHLTHIWDHNRSGNIMIYGIWFYIYNIVRINYLNNTSCYFHTVLMLIASKPEARRPNEQFKIILKKSFIQSTRWFFQLPTLMKRKRTIWWALLFSLNRPVNRKETELSFFRIIGSLSAFIFWVFLQRHISLDIFHLTGLIKNWIWKLSNSQCGQNNFHSSLSPTAESQDPGCQAWSTHRAQV